MACRTRLAPLRRRGARINPCDSGDARPPGPLRRRVRSGAALAFLIRSASTHLLYLHTPMLRVFSLTLALLALLASSATAQQILSRAAAFKDAPEMPGGKPGERIRALLDAVNRNDPEAVRRFILEHTTPAFQNLASMEMHQNVFLGARRQTGGVDFYGVRTFDPPRPGSTLVVVRDRNYNGWYGVALEFEPSGEARIRNIQFTPVRPGAAPEPGTPPERLTEAQFIDEARALVRRGCRGDAFSGAVLIARGAEVLLEHSCGEASKSFHAPNDMDTKFNLGSMNKMFTAVAVAQLVEGGRLSYDDPISKYVDTTWLPVEMTRRITVHHLLSHTSGLGSYFNADFMRSSRALYRDVNDYKPLVRNEQLAFAPGEQFRYSNTGMLLLGVVIERVTGQSYFDYVRAHIFKPAGMLSTDSYPMDEPVENLAMGYSPAPEAASGWRANLFEHVIKGGPAGGGYSTARDLHRFAQALAGGKLLSKETLARMWTDHSGAGYGYGFGIRETPAGKVVGHSGGFTGINSEMSLHPASGYVVVVLSNYDNGANPLVRRFEEMLAQVR